MCIKLKGSGMTAGQVMALMTRFGKATGTWGFNDGKQVNVRRESLYTVWNKWKDNRAILVADSFWEKDKQFVRSDGKLFNIAVIYNDRSEFSVITSPAVGIVKKFHGRMPLIIEDDYKDIFLSTGDMPQINEHNIVLKIAV